jgi:hypothetical protein
LDIADLRDGRLPSLSRQPSTRHGQPVRTLTLEALRGGADGGVPATQAPPKGRAFSQKSLVLKALLLLLVAENSHNSPAPITLPK